MHYKQIVTGLFASLFVSSSCLAAGSHPLYSCKTVNALAKKDNASKSNFIVHTMPNYIGGSENWEAGIEDKFAWINKNYPEKGNILILHVLNSLCKGLSADSNATEEPIENMYFFAIDWSFNYLKKKQ